MNSRKRLILLQSIQGFIETGRPIASKRLYELYDFGIKPAMLRIELGELDESGFLHQNHPSGGRYPTNKAYEYFIDYVLEKEDLDSFVPTKVRRIIEQQIRKQDQNSLVKETADFLHALGLLYDPNDRFVYAGFKNLIDELDIQHKDEFTQIVQDFEMIPQRLKKSERWWQKENTGQPKVFIGHSPVTDSEHLSVIAQNIDPKNGKLLMVIGPRRMDYRKSLGLFRILSQV